MQIELNQRIEHLTFLGNRFRQIAGGNINQAEELLINRSIAMNQWFTKSSILQSIEALGNILTKQDIENWINKYNLHSASVPKKIGLVLAGNLPLVGLHDIISVLITGNKAIVKLSAKDQELYRLVKDILCEKSGVYTQTLEFTQGDIKGVDAIIATGSDNTSRYFEYYFSKYPHIIRKNRTSVALLNGNESEEDLAELGKDIFSYFGLGCRNVAHLMVPEDYQFTELLKAIEPYNLLMQHNKYANNYDYQRVVALMNQQPVTDTGFVILKNSVQLASPVGVIHYQFYTDKTQAIAYLQQHAEKIQCIITSETLPFTTFAFGQAQKPALNDYADNVDTLKFLLNLN